mgnify:FL=1
MSKSIANWMMDIEILAEEYNDLAEKLETLIMHIPEPRTMDLKAVKGLYERSRALEENYRKSSKNIGSLVYMFEDDSSRNWAGCEPDELGDILTA